MVLEFESSDRDKVDWRVSFIARSTTACGDHLEDGPSVPHRKEGKAISGHAFPGSPTSITCAFYLGPHPLYRIATFSLYA